MSISLQVFLFYLSRVISKQVIEYRSEELKFHYLMHKAIAYAFLVSFIICLTSIDIEAQKESRFSGARHSIGLYYGYGSQTLLDVNYNYRKDLLQFQYLYSLTKYKSLDIELIIQPQYNLSKFRPVDDQEFEAEGYELGFNTGFLLRTKNVLNLVSFYGAIASGPHYVSDLPEIQSKGFNFASNFFIGLNFKVYKNLFLDFRSGFRHLSNANIKQPNKGINNIIFGGGFLLAIDKK